MTAGWLKNDFKHRLLRAINARRIHIVGCERSGTSMLTYAMVAFDDTLIHDKETSLWNFPSVRESIAIRRDRRFRERPPVIVTKRNAAWWQADRIERLIAFAQRYGVFIVNLVRDPRDVLTSKHPLDARRFYVEPSLWANEIEATDRLMSALAGYERKITLRYEDIVLSPEVVQNELCNVLGVRLREGVTSWKNLSGNVRLAGGGINNMIPYMHELRDFDPATIGKWRQDPTAREHVDALLANATFKGRLLDFMKSYRYS